MSERLEIHGGQPLDGTVTISGSKNATLPAMAAALALPGGLLLSGVPDLLDVHTMRQLLTSMGTTITAPHSGQLFLQAPDTLNPNAPWELVSRMRASVCVLGPLLSRFRHARVALPGGCNIGHRPIDLHLRGLAALGADISISEGCVSARCSKLIGTTIDLAGPAGPTVTGTCNILIAATLAKGHTIIRNAAREPEVQDLATLLNAAGARISYAGHGTIEIHGVDSLGSATHTVSPDRIEAGTFAVAALLTNGRLTLQHAPTHALTDFLELLQQVGARLTLLPNALIVQRDGPLRPAHAIAQPYPGIPTDLQAQLMALFACTPGESRITDLVFPERFRHAAELIRLGADIHVVGNQARIRGVSRLSGAPLTATDLRASAALVLAGLAASGTTILHRIHHLDRGYQHFDEKLRAVGGRVRRLSESSG
jgi:UDP-N-acetylglucosamine 1-carboxyvinyltransferase